VATLRSGSLRESSDADRPLSDVEDDVLGMADQSGSLSVDDLTELAKKSPHKALIHRQHAWATLNRLAKSGILGKSRGPRGTVRFMRPRDAILASLKNRGKLPEDCTPNDITEIAQVTGLNVLRVATEISEWDQVGRH